MEMIKLWGKGRGKNHNRGRTQPPRSGLVQLAFFVPECPIIVPRDLVASLILDTLPEAYHSTFSESDLDLLG